MERGPGAPGAARAIRAVYGGLLAGMAGSGAVLAAVRAVGSVPAVPAPRAVALGIAALAVAMLVVATRVLRPRVAERRPEQSADAYWGEATARGAAVVLWATVEGAGVVAAVGYSLTGRAAPALVALAALAGMVALRPGSLEANAGGGP